MRKDINKKLNLLRLFLIGFLAFVIAGGISLYFLCYLGASVFEIDTVFTTLPAGLAYLLFSIGVFIPYLYKRGDPIIAVCPFSKKEELIHLCIELGSSLIGLAIIITAINVPDHKMALMISGFILFFLPAMIYRLVIMIMKSRYKIKRLVVICVIFTIFILIPISLVLIKLGSSEFGYSYLELLYIIPLIILLSVGHKEDDLDD